MNSVAYILICVVLLGIPLLFMGWIGVALVRIYLRDRRKAATGVFNSPCRDCANRKNGSEDCKYCGI